MTTAIFTTATKVSGIRRSFEEGRRVPSIASGSNRPICFGDKIFARLILRGKTIVEFMANRVNDLTELLGAWETDRGTPVRVKSFRSAAALLASISAICRVAGAWSVR